MPDRPTIAHELDAPPWRRVDSTVMAASRAIRRAYDLRLAPTGLNQSEASVLALLADEGSMSQSTIARRIGMRRAAAGSIIDTLLSRELVGRLPDPTDGRVWLVVPLPAASELIEQIREIDETLRVELRRGISKEERRQLARTLETLMANVDLAIAETDR